MAMYSIPGIEQLVRQKVVTERKSHRVVSQELKEAYPNFTRGLSERSVRRFCSQNRIHGTSRLTDTDLDRVISSSVSMVGPSYGRRMMTGFLSGQGFRCGETRVGRSLIRVAPVHHSRRVSVTYRQMNPLPYSADYFGHKVHIDQNEKLVMFGVTHVCAVDGYSGKIVGFATMAKKNNVLIYEHLYRKMVLEYGLWDQLRVDHGREWYLMLHVHQSIAHLRGNCAREPIRQTSSTKNHTIERLWVEVNTRANYPLKAVLVEMVERDEICMDNETTQFCVSWVSMHVLNEAIAMFVTSWNAHPIPARRRGIPGGVPNRRMERDNRAQRISPTLLPSVDQAVQSYESNGGRLTDPSHFGNDPLDDERIGFRHRAFCQRFPSFASIFHSLVNGDKVPFKQALLFFIDVTRRLSA